MKQQIKDFFLKLITGMDREEFERRRREYDREQCFGKQTDQPKKVQP